MDNEINYNDKWKLQYLYITIKEFNDEIGNTVNLIGINENNDYTNLILQTTQKSIITMMEIINLCSLGFPDGALSLARNLFEQFVIICFFEHNKESADFNNIIHDYYLDAKLKQDKLQVFVYENFGDNNNCLEICQKNIEKCKNELANKKVKGDYWWSGYQSFSGLLDCVLSNIKDDSVKNLIQELHFGYKRACISLHSSCLGNILRLGKETDLSIIDTSPTELGLGLPLWFSISCFIMIAGVAGKTIKMSSEKYLERLNDLAFFYKSKIVDSQNS